MYLARLNVISYNSTTLMKAISDRAVTEKQAKT